MTKNNQQAKQIQHVLLDIMLEWRFLCQMVYIGRPFPMLIDGKVKPVYDIEDMQRYVYEQRPSLRGKDINIQFSNNRIKNY